MNTEIKKEKKSLSDLIEKHFSTSKYSLLNVFIFTLVCIIISRLIMLLLYSAWFTSRFDSFFTALGAIWDNAWYTSIIVDGYPTSPSGHENGDAASWAFFPLSPLTIRMVAHTFMIDYRIAGFVVNNLFFAIAMLIGYKYIMLTRNSPKKALIFILIMSFGPNNFYFSCLYTEALFVLLTLWFLYELARERYLLMGIAGALLSATRVTGVFMVFSVLIYLIYKHLKENKGSFWEFWKNVFLNPKLVLSVCIIPSGLFAYMYYLHTRVGDALAFTHIQKAWERNGSYLIDLAKALFNFDKTLSFSHQNTLAAGSLNLNSFGEIMKWLLDNAMVSIYYTAVFLVIITVTVSAIRKKKGHEAIPYVVPCAINVLTLGFINLSRYSSGTGIFIINLIDVIEEKFSKPLKIATFIILAVASFFLQLLWFDVHVIAIG